MTEHPETCNEGVALFGKLYAELKRLARAQRRGGASSTINTTALVHELYLAMAKRPECVFDNDRRFYAYAATAMRNLLIDRARSKSSARHGGDLVMVEISTKDPELKQLESVFGDQERALAVESAFNSLEAVDARAAEVAQLFVFAGQSIEAIAGILNVSSRTVDRDWRFARAYLRDNLVG